MFTSIVFVVVLKNNEYDIWEITVSEYLKYRQEKWFNAFLVCCYDKAEDAREYVHFANYELYCMNRA